jgi:hypothetical protein
MAASSPDLLLLSVSLELGRNAQQRPKRRRFAEALAESLSNLVRFRNAIDDLSGCGCHTPPTSQAVSHYLSR